ncbi:hypothetical protein BRADI_3g46356v3, partial [Brachypodium distachyon]
HTTDLSSPLISRKQTLFTTQSPGHGGLRPARGQQREPQDAPSLGLARGGRVPPLRHRRLRTRRERPRPGVPRRRDPERSDRGIPGGWSASSAASGCSTAASTSTRGRTSPASCAARPPATRGSSSSRPRRTASSPSRSSWAPSSSALGTTRGGWRRSRSARTGRSERARCARSRSSSCAPSTTASSSASMNFSGSLGSWNEGRLLRRAADPGRGRRRRRPAERRSPAASGLAGRPSWGPRVSS